MADDNRAQQVSLGCGTLILIALIVLFFSGRGNDELTREIHGLRSEISELKKSIDAQSTEIAKLRERLPPLPKAGEK